MRKLLLTGVALAALALAVPAHADDLDKLVWGGGGVEKLRVRGAQGIVSTPSAQVQATPARTPTKYAREKYAREEDAGDPGRGFAALIILVLLNFIPAIVAKIRQHNAALAIVCSDVFIDLIGLFVFTIPFCMLAWFGCLIWSLNSNTSRREMRIARVHARAIAEEAERRRQVSQIGYDAINRELD